MLKKIFFVIVLIFTNSQAFSQEFSLYNQFYGHYDFTMIGNTLNYNANSTVNSTCDLLTESSARLELGNNQIVKSAYLYWSGPGNPNQADLEVKLNGVPVVSERTYYLSFATNVGALGLFGAFADVTSLVKDFGNTEYTLSELDLRNLISRYCEQGINYGGWAMIIVYEEASLPKNLVTIYDGFTGIDGGNPDVTLLLDGFEFTEVTDSKIGFLVWEGDAGISNEQLRINDYVASNAINPPNNPFNSTNSFTNSAELWNMDLDYYMMDNYISEGDTSVKVQVITAGDVVVLNGIALSFGSVLPDATIEIDNVDVTCFNRTIHLHYTVSNLQGEHLLKQGTSIAFYIGEELIGTDETAFDILIGESISGSILLSTPNYYGVKFEVTAVVDDDGSGKGRVFETDEENNTDNVLVDLLDGCYIQKGVSPNGDRLNDGFDLEIFYLTQLKIYNRYGNLVYEHGEGYTNQWIGQDKNGKLLPAGTYYYVFTTSYGTYSGYVHLIREVK